jgi:hypothetical protein
MYVQVIEGRAADPARMKSLMERWMEELRPGASGFLGTTAGVAPDGRSIAIVRFDSAEAARANSDRPEQGRWWAEMEACYDGEVTFAESEDAEQFLAGGSNDAGFVQVMKGTGIDRESAARLDAVFEQHAAEYRPDLIGSLRVWTADDSAYDISYFTSEAEARAGEAKPMPPALQELSSEWQELMARTEFLDLSDPWLY